MMTVRVLDLQPGHDLLGTAVDQVSVQRFVLLLFEAGVASWS